MRSGVQLAVGSSLVEEQPANRLARTAAAITGLEKRGMSNSFRTEMVISSWCEKHPSAQAGGLQGGLHCIGLNLVHCMQGAATRGLGHGKNSARSTPGLPTMAAMFVHLRLHSEFSVVDGTCRINDVISAAAADGQPAMAITDLN